MKKIIFICLLLLIASEYIAAQNYGWITPNKTYLKMYLVEDGIYRISRTDFTNAGISTGSIDPRTVKVYNDGNQIPLYFSGESDGTFDANDFFDFYGKRNYGGITNVYDQFNSLAYTTNEYYDQYSDTNVYWVDWGGANGQRLSQWTYSTSSVYPNSYSFETVHFEKDLFYTPGENTSASDYRFLTTEKWKGEGWFWKSLADNQTLSDTVSLPLLNTTPQTVSFKIFAYPTVRNISILNEHSLQIRINNNLIATLITNDFVRIDTTITFSSSLLSAGSVNSCSIKYVPINGNTNGGMLIDYFEMQYPKVFKFSGASFKAALTGSDTTSKLFRISGYNSVNPVNIYDIANNYFISNHTSNLDTLKFTGRSNGKFEVYNNAITKKPFRIKQRQVPDLLSNSNGVDYLIIYHSLFTSQAEQLRAYRNAHDGFRAVKAEIEDLYDIFNYGQESPIGVKNFTKYVYDNWQLPKLKYICLMGRASLDPKKILSTSTYYINYVPTYGYPPSDGYFANMNIGTFAYYDMVALGRIPAYSVSEAQSMVDKIISYENQSPGEWVKKFIFITGGGTPNEQASHQSASNNDINNYVLPPSTGGEPVKIYRTDSSGYATFNLKDSIVKSIDRGSLVVNFRGHAGSHDWEVAMQDPNSLNNGTRLPFVLSLTCFTGENSVTSYRGFGEQFLYLANKGAIGFVGTTGWSYQQQGNDIGTSIYYSIKTDTTRRIGDLLKAAHKSISRDSLLFNARHTMNCYSLIGDPAATLEMSRKPDFEMTNSNYKLSNTFPMVGEKVSMTINPKNLGTYADSCNVRFQLRKNNIAYITKDTVFKNYRLNDSARFEFKIDTIANYSVSINLDYINRFTEDNEANNNLIINIPVKNIAFVPLKPVHNAQINTDSVLFSGLNPFVNTKSNNVKVLLQLDTNVQFNSSALISFARTNLSGVVTKFKAPLPDLTNGKLYYWRTNAIVNNDSSGWSTVQTFIYNNIETSVAAKNELSGDISSISTPVTVYKIKSQQFASSDNVNTYYNNNGIELQSFGGNLFARSYGSNAEESSYFSVGGNSIYIDAAKNTGLNMLKVNKVSGNIQEFKNLMYNSSLSNDSALAFLNTFTSNHYLMIVNSSYTVNGVAFNSAVRSKIKQFGSIYCDSITQIGYFHTWSFIGYLGATNGQVSEMYDACGPNPGINSNCNHWTESVSSMNVTFKKPSGSVSTVIGPAKSYTSLSWGQTLAANSSLYYDIYGIDNNDNQTLLMSNVQSNTFTDLSGINALQYPRLNLVARINIDTLTGNLSSALNSVKAVYTPAGELAVEYNAFRVASTYEIGEPMKFSFNYHNAGFTDMTGLIVNAYKKSITQGNLLLSDTVTVTLAPDSLGFYVNKFTIPHFRDSLRVYVQVIPKSADNDFYNYNNTVSFSMSSVHLTPQSSVQIFSDGQILNNGDYVRKNPEIKISISNSGSENSLLADTSRLKVSINDSYIPYYNNGNVNSLVRVSQKDNSISNESATMMLYPVLKEGNNKLSIVFKTGTDDIADTIVYDVIVSDELMIKDLANFPNPMSQETKFVFNLAGSVAPGNLKIKVFTVSGRMIKEINYTAAIGYNQIPWDGRDNDGDLVANGTYIYKLVADDDSNVETQTQKLVILR